MEDPQRLQVGGRRGVGVGVVGRAARCLVGLGLTGAAGSAAGQSPRVNGDFAEGALAWYGNATRTNSEGLCGMVVARRLGGDAWMLAEQYRLYNPSFFVDRERDAGVSHISFRSAAREGVVEVRVVADERAPGAVDTERPGQSGAIRFRAAAGWGRATDEY